MNDELLNDLKNVLYVDKVYGGVSEIRRRMEAPPTDELDLRLSELRLFSQNGEDGVTVDLLRHIPDIEPYFVEFGVGDGRSCNTRLLAEVFGWSGLYLEIDVEHHRSLAERYVHCDRISTICAAVTPENVNGLFEEAGVPENFGVLSVDIDGQDYWVWAALSARYRPDIVIAEVNTSFGSRRSVTERHGAQQETLTETFGASIRAMEKLGVEKGYRLVHVDMAGVNGFFVRDDFVARTRITGILDRSPNFGLRGRYHSVETLYQGKAESPRPLEEV